MQTNPKATKASSTYYAILKKAYGDKVADRIYDTRRSLVNGLDSVFDRKTMKSIHLYGRTRRRKSLTPHPA